MVTEIPLVALHFGLYPDDQGVLQIDNYWGRKYEIQLPLEGVFAYVSGSWKCWGPANQDTDGDDSLHILVHTRHYGPKDVDNILKALQNLPDTRGKWNDQIVVTSADDHSEVLTEYSCKE